MKKAYFLIGLVGAFASTMLSSCGCQTCTYAGYSEEVCKDDFGSKDLYKAYISYLEAFGANCK